VVRLVVHGKVAPSVALSECCTVPGKFTQEMKKYSRSKSVVKNCQKIHLKRVEILLLMEVCFLVKLARGNSK